MLSSLAQGRGNKGVCSRKMLSRRVLETKSIRRVLKKGKEKTDEGSSVLLYLMTEEGERE